MPGRKTDYILMRQSSRPHFPSPFLQSTHTPPYPPPLSFRLSECNERTEKSLACRFGFFRFLRSPSLGRKERSDGIAIATVRSIASMTRYELFGLNDINIFVQEKQTL